MVKPLLYQMMGCKIEPIELCLPLGFDFSRKKADRPEFIPVNFTKDGHVVPLPYHGSAHIHAVCLANALMFIPEGAFALQEGEKVIVRPLIF